MAKKTARVIVTLECTEAKKEGKPASRYTTEKNKTNTPDRMEIKKYNPFLRRHTVHKEVMRKHLDKVCSINRRLVESFLQGGFFM